jgi:hypothetical protein
MLCLLSVLLCFIFSVFFCILYLNMHCCCIFIPCFVFRFCFHSFYAGKSALAIFGKKLLFGVKKDSLYDKCTYLFLFIDGN